MSRPMGRPRQRGSKDLPTGLYRDARGYRARHPVTGRYVRLGSDKASALRLFEQLRATWSDEALEAKANALVARLQAAGGSGLTFAGYCRQYLEAGLPGRPLATKTRRDYENILRRVDLDTPVELVDAVALRRYLAPSLDNPSYYNYQLACLSRVCKHAVDEGLLTRNPCKDIDRRQTEKRRTYITDEDYLAITGCMSCWHQRIVDWIYLVSHNPVDCLTVREDELQGGVLRVERNKTGERVDIELAPDAQDLVAYFRGLKRAQGIVSPYLVVFLDGHLVGRPPSVDYIGKRWRRAAKAAGLAQYQLRDVRPKGLTDEAREAGAATDKGAHASEAMKRHYVRVALPKRVKSKIARIRAE